MFRDGWTSHAPSLTDSLLWNKLRSWKRSCPEEKMKCRQNHPRLYHDLTLLLLLIPLSLLSASCHRSGSCRQTLILLLNQPLCARQPYAYVRNPSMKILENQYEKAHHPIWISVLPGSFFHQENPAIQASLHDSPNQQRLYARQGN